MVLELQYKLTSTVIIDASLFTWWRYINLFTTKQPTHIITVLIKWFALSDNNNFVIILIDTNWEYCEFLYLFPSDIFSYV